MRNCSIKMHVVHLSTMRFIFVSSEEKTDGLNKGGANVPSLVLRVIYDSAGSHSHHRTGRSHCILGDNLSSGKYDCIV